MLIMKYLTLAWAHLKWVLDFLLYYPFYKLHDSQLQIMGEEVSTCHYESSSGSEEDIDCAVCLCKVKEGEEIRVLRCDHLFHRDCLDRWVVGFKNGTCPLCREPVDPRRAISEFGAEVLFFKFCSNLTNDDRDTWWLR